MRMRITQIQNNHMISIFAIFPLLLLTTFMIAYPYYVISSIFTIFITSYWFESIPFKKLAIILSTSIIIAYLSLEKLILLTIILIIYNISKWIRSEKQTKILCSICLEELDSKSNFVITSCNHSFHSDCLLKWLNNNNNCPLCRNKLIDKQYSDINHSDSDNDINNYNNYIDPLDRLLDE